MKETGIGKIITLENGKKYLILDFFVHNKNKYLYLSSLDMLDICFVIVNGNNITIVKDEKLIKEFATNYIDKQIKKTKE